MSEISYRRRWRGLLAPIGLVLAVVSLGLNFPSRSAADDSAASEADSKKQQRERNLNEMRDPAKEFEVVRRTKEGQESLELRGKGNSADWMYLIVNMTTGKVHLRLDDAEVWVSRGAAERETWNYFTLGRME